jgi:peptidylprolyl isomerase
VATTQRRRSTERQLLQRQLAERRVREARRRRVVLISSIGVLVATSGSGGKKTPAASAGCKTGFMGVTVQNKTNLKAEPGVKSTGCETPKKLQYQDLVTGKGKAASPTSTVQVQYTGVVYKDGKQFDSSWERKQAATFSLQQVVKGFTQGIGGGSGVPPMKVGGRRTMILPGALGYGAQGNSQAGIAPNAPLVFVVDLLAVK